MIVLNGRFAGRKAVVIRCFDDGHKERKFGHALVAGIERAPRKVTKKMAKDNAKKAVRAGARGKAGVGGEGASSQGGCALRRGKGAGYLPPRAAVLAPAAR